MTEAERQRRRQLELLLGTLDDYLGADAYGRVWSGYGRAMPGPAPSSRRPCRSCDGVGRTIPSGRPCVACRNGQPRLSHACVDCPSCDGKGRQWVDDYTGAPVAHVERRAPKRLATGTAKARRTVHAVGLEVHVDRWHSAQARQEATGSYAALRRCMARLESEDPRAARMVRLVYVRGMDRGLAQRERRRLERGMASLGAWMPTAIRLPQWLAERVAVEQRRELAADLLAEGVSNRELRRRGLRKRHRVA